MTRPIRLPQIPQSEKDRRGNKLVWDAEKAEKYVKDIWREIAN